MLLFRLPSLVFRKLLLPVEAWMDEIARDLEKVFEEEQEKQEALNAVADKAAEELKKAFYHDDGSPVYANEGREN